MVRLTIKEVAERLRVKPVTVYRLVSARLVRVERIGPGKRTIRITEEDLEAYLNGTATPTKEPEPRPVAVHRRVKLRHLAD